MTDAHLIEYRTKRPVYKALCNEISRIIENSFEQSNVKCHSIDARAKEIDSFGRKLKKTDEDGSPKYKNPLKEITDLAGVRVIVYTIDDIEIVTDFLDKNFSVLEKRDVGEERVEKGQFGYQSIHYLIELTGERLSLPDFSAYRDYICEIQIRTVLQHAWAEMEHDIQYQGSKNIPKSVKRKFLSLAGLLEIADREFSSIQRDDKALKKGVLTDLQKDLTRDAITLSGELSVGDSASISAQDESVSHTQVRTLLATGNYSEAIEVYNKKILLEPTSYTLFMGRARALFLMGETDRALRDIDKADELNPSDPDISNFRSKITDGSMSLPKNMQYADANSTAKKGDEALASGRPEEAYILYSDALDCGASWPFTTLKMALAGVVAGDLTGAELLLNELSIHPGTPMEINIAALRAILYALQRSEEFPKQLDHLVSLINDKGDFMIELSPLVLLKGIDQDKFEDEQAEKVDAVFVALNRNMRGVRRSSTLSVR